MQLATRHGVTVPDPQATNIETAYNYHYDALGNLVHDAAAHIDAIDWTVAGKVKRVDHATGQGPDLEFAYGAGGQRISKQVGGAVGDPGTYREHYIRDAQGNIMATYRLHANGAFRLQERPIYGSSRVGLYAAKVDLYPAGQIVPMPQVIPVFDGLLRYELNDHLGNVGTVVTGRLLPGQGAPHEAEVISAQGYEPGGSLLPGRNYSSSTYNYGFNGMRKDDEIHGATGTSYDFGMRGYDPRIGRFWSIDPRTHEYPWQTPYAYHRNNFIAWIDYMGGGDPPKVVDGVYFVQLKNPNAQVVFNMGLNTFTGMMRGRYDNAKTVDYTVNTQQYRYSNFFSGGLRALSSSTGSNPYITMGQNVDNGRVSGDGTDGSRGYLAQDQNGQWQGGLGNPPQGSAAGFGGGIPIVVGGQLYGEQESGEYCESRGYAQQNSKNVGKVIIGYNSTSNSLVLVVSPDGLESGGMTLDAIRDKLVGEGYDYVFGFDGGSSSTLIQDGDDVLVAPTWYKDNTIPAGVTVTGE